MTTTGRVLAVTTLPLGDELLADHGVGVTELVLTDTVDFDEEGGFLQYAETEVIEYVSVDDDNGVITLAAPTTVAGYEGDVVRVWNPETSDYAYEHVAHVAIEGAEDCDSDAMEATLPLHLVPYFDEGVRSGATEYVLLEWRGDDLYVTDLLRREPAYDPAYLPDSEAGGNSVYRGDAPPWANGDTTKSANNGDLWYDTLNDHRPHIWNGTDAVWVDAADPDVDLIPGIVSDIENNNANIDNLSASMENTQETATKARDLASTADGRVSISDYDPAPGDTQYYAENSDGSLMLDANGNPMLLSRNEGSVWFTRTRARINYCTNPSFEIDTAGWTTTAATGAQFDPVAPTVPIDGTYGYRIVNDATVGDHTAQWAGGTPGIAVTPGQTWASSVFALLESGVGTGTYASVRFYDSASVFLSEESATTTVALLVDDWQEIGVSATVPDLAAFMVIVFHNPNANDVWIIDGVLLEQAEQTGRYFDGDSYDAEWQGTPHASASNMEGGKIVSVYELFDNGWTRLDFTGTTQYDANASDLTKGTLAAERIGNNTVGIEKMKTNKVVASEALLAGDFVHVWSNNGLFMVRKASAQNNYEAHGFVLDDAATGAAVSVYTEGYNPLCSDLSPGAQFLSTTAGEATSHAPASAGQTIQRIGVATDATTLHFNPVVPIRLT